MRYRYPHIYFQISVTINGSETDQSGQFIIWENDWRTQTLELPRYGL